MTREHLVKRLTKASLALSRAHAPNLSPNILRSHGLAHSPRLGHPAKNHALFRIRARSHQSPRSPADPALDQVKLLRPKPAILVVPTTTRMAESTVLLSQLLMDPDKRVRAHGQRRSPSTLASVASRVSIVTMVQTTPASGPVKLLVVDTMIAAMSNAASALSAMLGIKRTASGRSRLAVFVTFRFSRTMSLKTMAPTTRL